jgi:hypothetical protein
VPKFSVTSILTLLLNLLNESPIKYLISSSVETIRCTPVPLLGELLRRDALATQAKPIKNGEIRSPRFRLIGYR